MKLLTNILFLLVFLGVSPFGFSQEKATLGVSAFVKDNRVLLRWAPATPEVMVEGLRHGYRIDRIDAPGSFENNASLQTFTIPSFADRKAGLLQSSDQETAEMSAFISAFMDPGISEPTRAMSYALLQLGASTNKKMAVLTGLYLEDSLVQSKTYLYRVSLVNSLGTAAEIQVNASVATENQEFSTLSGSARPRLKEAYLSWEAESLKEGYAAYWIERSEDSLHFSRRNPVPYVFFKSQYETDKTYCDFVDTAVSEGRTYFYRITGINHFFETGKTSNVVRVYIPRSLYGECRVDTIWAQGFNREIRARFISARRNEPEKLLLYRSDSVLAGYQLLAEQPYTGPTSRFTVAVPVESGDRFYYRVAAVSMDGDTVFSYPYYFFTLDQVPPSQPANLSGAINDSGVVRLSWTSNPEADILGYRVFRSNSLNEEFTEVTQNYCKNSLFYDTLQLDNLTPEVYYQVTAVDLNYNNSERSESVLLLKPDTIPPVPPVFTDYRVSTEGISLTWINSTSRDISGTLLVRQGGLHADTLHYWSDSTGFFLDTTGVAGSVYDYSLVARDKSGNATPSTSLSIHFETGIRKGVSGLRSVISREQKEIRIAWDLPPGEIYSIQVYRAKNDEPFRLVKTIRDASATEFTDRDLSINNIYRYSIRVIFKSGVSSTLSAPLEAVY